MPARFPTSIKHRDRFRTSHVGDVRRAPRSVAAISTSRKARRRSARSQIGKILERLDEREQKIIISRFGLDHGHEPLTLKEVGAEMGVTKERIRQIEARALSKLRIAAQEEKIEVPGPELSLRRTVDARFEPCDELAAGAFIGAAESGDRAIREVGRQFGIERVASRASAACIANVFGGLLWQPGLYAAARVGDAARWSASWTVDRSLASMRLASA